MKDYIIFDEEWARKAQESLGELKRALTHAEIIGQECGEAIRTNDLHPGAGETWRKGNRKSGRPQRGKKRGKR